MKLIEGLKKFPPAVEGFTGKFIKNAADAAAVFFVVAALFLGVGTTALNIFLKPYAMGHLSELLKCKTDCSFVYLAPSGGPRIILRNVTLSNDFGRILHAETASIFFDISDIRQKKISFREILFDGCDAIISKKKGTFSIQELIESVTAPSKKPPEIKISVGRISFVKSGIKFSDTDSGEHFSFPSSSVHIDLTGTGTKIFFISNFASMPFTVIAKYSKGWRIAAKNRGVPLAGILNVLGYKANIKGSLDTDIVYKGDFKKKNILDGNLFFKDVKYGGFAFDGQVFFDANKFDLELKGPGRRATASGVFSGGAVLFSNACIDFEDIKAEAAGSVSSRYFNFEGQFRELKITSALFKGSVDGTIRANGVFKDLKNIDVEAQILKGEGEFSKLSLLYNVLQTLDVFNYLIGKFPKYTSNFPVTDMSGKITKKGALIKIDDALIENEQSRTSVLGNIDIGKNEVDIVVGFQVQKFINDVISKIPVVGYILLDEKKSLLPVFVKVSGVLSKPSVKVMPAKTITGPLIGIVEKTFKIPFKLFEKGKKGGEYESRAHIYR